MGFRSEEEALHAKNRALEDALAEARQTLDVLQPRLEHVEELERELAKTRADLAKLTGPRKPRSTVLWAAGAGFALVFVLLTTMALVQRAQVSAAEAEAELALRAAQDAERARAAEAELAHAEAERAAAEAAARATPPEPFAVRVGRVVAVTGPAPAAEGAECTLTLERAPESSYDARLHIACDGRTVYGAPRFGYVPCTFEQDVPIRCEDRTGSSATGDPMVVLDLGTHTAVLSDGPELPWTLRIALTP